MQARLEEQLKMHAAAFLEYEGNKSSLLTVTGIEMTDGGKTATILFTVFPDTMEKTALEFAKRKRSEFRKYIRDHSAINRIPHLDFGIDRGEKNRQRIEELTREIK